MRAIPACLTAAAAVLTVAGCGAEPGSASAPVEVPAARPLPADATGPVVRTLEEMARSNPDDFVARNKLAARYLGLLRETGSVEYLRLARRAADESLAILPAEQNPGALAGLAQAEFAAHEFAAARDHAIRWREMEPEKLGPVLLLSDALLELGRYDDASEVLAEIARRGPATTGANVDIETRLARYDLLRGKNESAERRFASALQSATAMDPPVPETVAWCYWQLGEVAVQTGRYELAEQRYRDALTTIPDYHRAVAGLGRARAALGDVEGAIAQLERVTRRLPDPGTIAALGDLYAAAGRSRDAETQYALVEQTARLDALNGSLYNRQVAICRANRGVSVEEAFASVSAEYEVRRDVYGADALAWAALAAGRHDTAEASIRDALRLGTRDPRIQYHAGRIAQARGEPGAARRHYEAALAASPAFDPLQAPDARRRLESL